MKITILGSGSEGNSTLIEINNLKILIDVGFSYKQLKNKLASLNIDPKEIKHLLITHEHSDHTKGLNIFLNKVKPNLYIKNELREVLIECRDYDKTTLINEEFFIENVFVRVLPLSHDAVNPVGYLIEEDESLVYITDTGYIHKRILNLIENKNYYIIESNHDTEMLINGPYPLYLQKRILSDKGHISNDFCGTYLSKIIGEKTKKIILAHLSKTNNSPDIALNTVTRILKENGINFENIECANEEELVKM